MSDFAEFEVVVDCEEVCASASGPYKDAYNEAMKYAYQYSANGRVVEVFEVKRTLISFIPKDSEFSSERICDDDQMDEAEANAPRSTGDIK